VVEPVQDVFTGGLLVQRVEVAGGDDTLMQLLQLPRHHQVAQFLLAHQEDLQQRLVVLLQVGEQAQFLQCRGGEILRRPSWCRRCR